MKSNEAPRTGAQDGSRALPISPEAKPAKSPVFLVGMGETSFLTFVPESKTDEIQSPIFGGHC